MQTNKLELALDARANERYELAHSILIECLESAANIGDRHQLANALLIFANNVLEWCPEGEDPFESRRVAADEAFSLFRDLEDSAGEARALLILAGVDFGRSAELTNAALAIGRRLGDKGIMCQAMYRLGNQASVAGRTEEAIEIVEEAVRLAEESGDAELFADALFVLGVVHDDSESRVAAFAAMAGLEQRYQRKRRFVHHLSAAASLIGDVQPARAIDWYNRCLSIARSLSDAQSEGSVLRGLAQIERARGNNRKAEELDALSSVMCPLPDLTEVIKAAEARDVQALDKAMRSLVLKKSP